MALPDWLKNFPQWLHRLAEDPAAEELGLAWLSQADGQQRAQSMAEAYTGEGSPMVPLPTPVRTAARKMLNGKVAVATGPKMPMRVTKTAIETLFMLDQNRPEELLLALSRDYPPFLWIPAGTTVASIRAALSGYFPKEAPKRENLHRTVRYFFGNERMLDTDIYGVENHYVASPFTAELSWGSAMHDDPWPAQIEGDVNTVSFMTEVRQKAKQDPRAVYTTSYRLQHSRGILTLEDHLGMFVIEIRYLPSPNRDVVVGLNRRFDYTFPADMPVDGVAALLGLSLQTEASLKDTLADHELAEDHDLVLHALSALKFGDLTLANDLRPFLRPPVKTTTKPGSLRAATIPPPPNVRDAALALAQELDFDALVIKSAAVKPEQDVLNYIDHVLDGTPPRGWEGDHGPHLLIAGEAVVRQSIDWIWGDQGWEMVREVPRGSKQLFQRHWRTRDGSAEIGYVEDHRLGLRFFTVEGEGKEAAQSRLRSAVTLEDLSAALVAAETLVDPGERAGAILKIARLAPKAEDPRWMKLFEGGLKHDNLAVRSATLVAAAYIAWLDLIGLIQSTAGEVLETQAERAIQWIRLRS
jgi:hypothetical protein